MQTDITELSRSVINYNVWGKVSFISKGENIATRTKYRNKQQFGIPRISRMSQYKYIRILDDDDLLGMGKYEITCVTGSRAAVPEKSGNISSDFAPRRDSKEIVSCNSSDWWHGSEQFHTRSTRTVPVYSLRNGAKANMTQYYH